MEKPKDPRQNPPKAQDKPKPMGTAPQKPGHNPAPSKPQSTKR